MAQEVLADAAIVGILRTVTFFLGNAMPSRYARC